MASTSVDRGFSICCRRLFNKSDIRSMDSVASFIVERWSMGPTYLNVLSLVCLAALTVVIIIMALARGPCRFPCGRRKLSITANWPGPTPAYNGNKVINDETGSSSERPPPLAAHLKGRYLAFKMEYQRQHPVAVLVKI